MSVEQMCWADNEKTGDPRLKLLLLILADGTHALDGLSERSEMTQAEVRTCLQRLIDMELVYRAAGSAKYYLMVDSFGERISQTELTHLHDIYEKSNPQFFSIHDVVHHGQSIAEVMRGAR